MISNTVNLHRVNSHDITSAHRFTSHHTTLHHIISHLHCIHTCNMARLTCCTPHPFNFLLASLLICTVQMLHHTSHRRRNFPKNRSGCYLFHATGILQCTQALYCCALLYPLLIACVLVYLSYSGYLCSAVRSSLNNIRPKRTRTAHRGDA